MPLHVISCVEGTRMNKGKLIAGVTLIAEGAALALYGARYLDFMERNGLMDMGKRLIRATGIRSRRPLVAIGIAEAVIGVALLSSARAQQQQWPALVPQISASHG
jgi:hypothetical protein